MGNYTILGGFENPRTGRQARNLTINVPKILDLKSSSEQIFSKNWRWVPLLCVNRSPIMVFAPAQKLSGLAIQDPVAGGVWKIKLECLCKWWQVSFSLRMKKKKNSSSKSSNSNSSLFSLLRCQMKQMRQMLWISWSSESWKFVYSISYRADGSLAEKSTFSRRLNIMTFMQCAWMWS